MSTDHTVFPWEHVPSNGHHGHYIVAGSGVTVCDLYAMTQPISGEPKAADFTDAAENAAFIARACNAHDEMVTQLRGIVAAFRCILSDLDIDEDATTLRIMAGGREVVDVPVSLLLANANAAIAKAEGTS